MNPWFSTGAAWGTDNTRISMRNLFRFVQYLLRCANIAHIHSPKIEFPQSMETPWICCFSVSLPGSSTLRNLLILSFSAAPKPHHLENSTSRAVHACQLEGRCPVGRGGLLEEQRCMKYSQTKSQAIPFHPQKENNYGKICEALNTFREIAVLHNYFLIYSAGWELRSLSLSQHKLCISWSASGSYWKMSMLITTLPLRYSAPAATLLMQNFLFTYFYYLFCLCKFSHLLFQVPEYCWKEQALHFLLSVQLCSKTCAGPWERGTAGTASPQSSNGNKPQIPNFYSSSLPPLAESNEVARICEGRKVGMVKSWKTTILCAHSDPHPLQRNAVLGETYLKELGIPEVFLIAFHSSPKRNSAVYTTCQANYSHIFLFSQHTGICPLSIHKKIGLVFPLLFLSYSYSKTKAGNHISWSVR